VKHVTALRVNFLSSSKNFPSHATREFSVSIHTFQFTRDKHWVNTLELGVSDFRFG
jgi:hypothetical protein